MSLQISDWVTFAGFFAFVVGFAVWRGRGSGASEESYFLAGRALPWWLIGISIVAANISTEQFVGMAGQGAGAVGLAVTWWQLVGSVFIVIIALTLLPRFLRAGIYTMPEYLEYRYDVIARTIFAVLTVIAYVVVLLTAVLYSGGLTLHTLFEIDLKLAVWTLGAAAAAYTAWGGLKAVAWADLIQGSALLIGGLVVFGLGLQAVGGWESFATTNADKLHMVLPANNASLPWTSVLAGMWIVMIYYCGLNQFIVQRNLAAKSLRDGQLGMVFAGGIWLLVPFAIVMPGIMAFQLYPDALAETPDKAYPMLIANLLPAGLRGFLLAALAGAITSSLASMLNSASTIFTLDLWQRLRRNRASERNIVWLGRCAVLIFIAIGCTLAPLLSNPSFGGVFQYVQQSQGYIWPGVVAAFIVGIYVEKTPPLAGTVALVFGPIFYGILQYLIPEIHFLIHVAIAFLAAVAVMLLITVLRPLAAPRKLPEVKDIDLHSSRSVKVFGLAVIAGAAIFIVCFW